MNKINFFKTLLLYLLVACNVSNEQSENNISIVKNEISVEDFEFQFQDFEEFYDQFISDSVFQLSRIKFPLRGNLANYESEKDWTKENWSFINWDFRKEILNSDDSISIDQRDNHFFFGTYCRDCGFSFEMAFDKIDQQWYLTYRQENNY